MNLADPESLPIELYRRFYAEEIRAVANLTDSSLFAAFGRVPRERFVAPPPWRIAGEMYLSPSANQLTQDPRDLYHNVLVSLKTEKSLNNGQPSALAIWINALSLTKGARVFHVGCGTGYYTAILAETVGPTGFVVAAEVEPDLAAQALENLRAYSNVSASSCDAASLDPGPCDAILVNAGVTHPHIPWLLALKDGGRMAVPITMSIGPNLGKGLMLKITRHEDRFLAEVLSMVAIYSSPSVRNPELEQQLSKAFESRELLKVKSIRLDSHTKSDSCLAHASDVCVSAE